MHDNNLFINDGIIYYKKDGCSKQYICANEMFLLSLLSFTYRVITDRWENATDHDRSKIDGFDISDKKYLKQKMVYIRHWRI